jgi:hypothetical protein
MRFARILEHGQEYLVGLRRGLCGAVRHIEETTIILRTLQLVSEWS